MNQKHYTNTNSIQNGIRRFNSILYPRRHWKFTFSILKEDHSILEFYTYPILVRSQKLILLFGNRRELMKKAERTEEAENSTAGHRVKERTG